MIFDKNLWFFQKIVCSKCSEFNVLYSEKVKNIIVFAYKKPKFSPNSTYICHIICLRYHEILNCLCLDQKVKSILHVILYRTGQSISSLGKVPSEIRPETRHIT